MLKACNSEANSLIWPKIELVQDFILVLANFEKDPIKPEGAIISATFFAILSGM